MSFKPSDFVSFLKLHQDTLLEAEDSSPHSFDLLQKLLAPGGTDNLDGLDFSNNWKFYLDASSDPKIVSQTDFAASLQVLGQLKSVQQFCESWNDLSQADAYKLNSDLRLFKEDIKPLWEDPENANGGRFILTFMHTPEFSVEKVITLFLNLLVHMVCGQLGHEEDICGAGLSIRKWGLNITVWNKDSAETDAREFLEDRLAELFPVEPRYQLHDTTIKNHDRSRKALTEKKKTPRRRRDGKEGKDAKDSKDSKPSDGQNKNRDGQTRQGQKPLKKSTEEKKPEPPKEPAAPKPSLEKPLVNPWKIPPQTPIAPIIGDPTDTQDQKAPFSWNKPKGSSWVDDDPAEAVPVDKTKQPQKPPKSQNQEKVKGDGKQKDGKPKQPKDAKPNKPQPEKPVLEKPKVPAWTQPKQWESSVPQPVQEPPKPVRQEAPVIVQKNETGASKKLAKPNSWADEDGDVDGKAIMNLLSKSGKNLLTKEKVPDPVPEPTPTSEPTPVVEKEKPKQQPKGKQQNQKKQPKKQTANAKHEESLHKTEPEPISLPEPQVQLPETVTPEPKPVEPVREPVKIPEPEPVTKSVPDHQPVEPVKEQTPEPEPELDSERVVYDRKELKRLRKEHLRKEKQEKQEKLEKAQQRREAELKNRLAEQERLEKEQEEFKEKQRQKQKSEITHRPPKQLKRQEAPQPVIQETRQAPSLNPILLIAIPFIIAIFVFILSIYSSNQNQHQRTGDTVTHID